MPWPVAVFGLACQVLFLSACFRAVPTAGEGQSLYRANGCASCHGIDGAGDGPMAAKLSSQPTDLRDTKHFKNGAGEFDIAKTLINGIPSAQPSSPELHHTHHDLAMPKFDHLTNLERRSLALYVISLSGGSVQP